MAELWPADLPQKLNVDGHTLTFGNPVIRSNPDVGPVKTRPRSSAVAQPFSGQMYLTTAQLASLRTFYSVTVRGADVFIFPDPEAETASPDKTILCRFTAPPTVSATHVAGTWSVALPLEIVP